MLGRRAKPEVVKQREQRGFDDFEMRLGDVMRGERATLGKSLLDVQRDLKIKANYVAAIENSDVSAFETPGFVAGYVRSYARYLGLDPEWAYGTFRRESRTEASAPVGPVTAAARSLPAAPSAAALRDPLAHPRTPFVPHGEAVFSHLEPAALGSLAVLLALIVGLGYGAWSFLQQIQQVRISPIDQAPGIVAQLDPLARATGVDGASLGRGLGTPKNLSNGGAAFERLYRPEALDAPVLTARDAPISTLDPNVNGALAPDENSRLYARSQNPPDPGAVPGAVIAAAVPAASVPTSGVQVVAAAAPQLELVAVHPAWVRVTAADGTVILQKILNAGERYTLPKTAAPPSLRAGNSGAVYFAVNGKTFGPAGRAGSVVKHVTLSAAAITGAYKLADTAADPALAKLTAVADAGTGTGN